MDNSPVQELGLYQFCLLRVEGFGGSAGLGFGFGS